MMQFIDIALTAIFFVCSAVIYLNVAALWRDRAIKGVSVYPMIVFFTVDCLQAIRFPQRGIDLPRRGCVRNVPRECDLAVASRRFCA